MFTFPHSEFADLRRGRIARLASASGMFLFTPSAPRLLREDKPSAVATDAFIPHRSHADFTNFTDFASRYALAPPESKLISHADLTNLTEEA